MLKKSSEDIPDISIVIPVYNVEKYISQCLDSIINQTLKNIEIICIDDCSTDSSNKIIREYEEKYDSIILLKNKENSGASFSRNKGLDIAKGKYICFIDSDDWIEKDTLEYTFNTAEDNNLDILLYKSEIFKEETETFKRSDTYSLNILKEFENTIFNFRDINPDNLYNISTTPHGKLFSRKLIEENNIRFMAGVIFEDNLFFNECFLKSKRVSVIDKYFYNRRVHSESVMNSKGEELLSIISISEGMMNVLLKNEDLYKTYERIFFNKIFYRISSKFKEIDKNLINEYYSKFKEFVYRLLLDYRLNDDIQNNLWYLNLQNYNLVIKSIDTSKKEIIDIQRNIKLNYKISVLIDCKDKTVDEIKEIFKSLINQDIGFSFLDIYFLDNNFEVKETINRYKEMFYNVHIIRFNKNYQKYSYMHFLNIISTNFVIFINYTINKSFLNNLFDEINTNHVITVLPTKESYIKKIDSNNIFLNDTDINSDIAKDSLTSIENKLFETEFIKNEDLFSEDDNGNIVLNSKVYINRNFSEENLINYIEYMIENNSLKEYDFIVGIFKEKFYNKQANKKTIFFENIKYIFKKLIEYEDYDKITSSLTKNNKEYFDLVIKSIESEDSKIKDIQKNIKLYVPISIIIYISDYSIYELNNIIHRIIRQNIGFAHLEVLLLNKNSRNPVTRKKLDEIIKTYYNINYIDLDDECSIKEAYNTSLNSIDKPYLMFTNMEFSYRKNAINNMFRAICKDNMNLATGYIKEENTDLPEDNIYTKIFKKKFIDENNIQFQITNDTVVVDPKVHNLKGLINVDIPVIERDEE